MLPRLRARLLRVPPIGSRRPSWTFTLVALATFAMLTHTTDGLATTFEGTVYDADTGAPLPHAHITLQATNHSTTTDQNGRYTLHVNAEDAVQAEVLAAAHKGYFTQGIPLQNAHALDFHLDKVNEDTGPLAPLPSASACQGCHTQQVVDWEQSRMAHAGDNRWVEDLYAGTGTPSGSQGFVYTRDAVHASSNPTSECASCHQPERWIDDPFSAYEGHEHASESSRRGVSCATCHLMADVDESALNFPGLFPHVVTFTRNSEVRYGVLGDVTYHATGRMRASLQPQITSVVCATCHQDASDPTGEGDFDGPLSEATYSEWKNSPYGDPASEHYQSCMGCHSEPSHAPSASTLQETNIRPSGQIKTHRFEGTTPEFLRNAVDLSLEVEPRGNTIIARLLLRNRGAGHHVPTGVTIRNMILLVEAFDDSGPLPHLGEHIIDPLGGVGPKEEGYYAGLPGKLYAKINASDAGDTAVLFTEAVHIDRDTRLAPFQEDVLEFPFEVRDEPNITVRARLIYRRAWRVLIDTKKWTEDGQGRPLADLEAPHFGTLMADAQWMSADAPKAQSRGCAVAPQPTAPRSQLLAHLLLLALWMSMRCLPRVSQRLADR